MRIEQLKQSLLTRNRTKKVSTIVFHATADNKSGAMASINWLRQIGLSYHYIIERNGVIIKCAPVNRVAFHAGKSFGPEGENVNQYSIGIAFANDNLGEEITAAQEVAARILVRDLAKAIPSIKWITTHRDIAPNRKTDPKGWTPYPILSLEYWKK